MKLAAIVLLLAGIVLAVTGMAMISMTVDTRAWQVGAGLILVAIFCGGGAMFVGLAATGQQGDGPT